MNDLLWELAQPLITWLTLVLLNSWLLALAYPILREHLLGYSARLRSGALLGGSVLPGLIALFVTLLYSNAHLSSHFLIEHCHAGVCTSHEPHLPAESWYALSSLFIGLSLLFLSLFLLYRCFRNVKRSSDSLRTFIVNHEEEGYQVIELDKPMAWCQGVLTPKIVLSSGLLASLNEQQLQAVIAHERAHAENFDNLRKVILYCATLFWPRTRRALIVRDFTTDLEGVCDLAAVSDNDSKESLVAVIDVLTPVYSGETVKLSHTELNPRLSQLHNELRYSQYPNEARHKQTLRVCFGFMVVSVALFTLSVSLGHHLLEILLA